MSCSIEKLSLYNPENDTFYEVFVSPEDAQRASNDMSFASLLLMQAMREKERMEGSDPAFTDASDPPIGVDVDVDIGGQPADGPEKDTDDGSGSGLLYRWSSACVLFLLETYKSFKEKLTNGKQSQKKVWEEIAKILNSKGHNLTGPQCAAKLRSLEKTYKAVKDHNNKSGNDRRNWQFFQLMDEIFATAAWCEPVAVDSSPGLSTRQDCSSPVTTTRADSGCEDEPAAKKSNIPTLLAKRLRLKEKSEEEKAKRHEDRMALEERRMALDSKLVDVLESLVKNSKS